MNATQVTAWRQRRLVFEWQTLAEIADEFNRYNQSPHISTEGREARERRYTAVFDADHIQPFIDFLQNDPQLSVVRKENELLIRSRALTSVENPTR